jgi:predicted kinase
MRRIVAKRGRVDLQAMFVMISGPPGSGKSTLARPIADELQLPLIAKDAIKEALMDVLGYPATVEQSRTLGRAAVVAMLNVATESLAGAVLDSTFFPYAFPRLRSLPGPLLEVHCSCPREVAVGRYSARSPTRHAGHLDADRQPHELWNEQNTRPSGIAPSIVVDTTAPVDVTTVIRQVKESGTLTSGSRPSVPPESRETPERHSFEEKLFQSRDNRRIDGLT